MRELAVEKNQIPESVFALIARLVDRVAWPARRQAMADVTVVLLAGKARRAEGVFGWGRPAVALGLKELASGSQFLLRMVEYADREKLAVRLIYYPPYHSKYNGIERAWGGLERSWNGYLLDSVVTVLLRAANFCWRTNPTTSRLVEGVYEQGVTLATPEKRALEKRRIRSETLPWWDITSEPQTVL